MFSAIELRRVFAEWQLRLRRVQTILQPPTWTEEEWRQFSQALTLLVQKHGRAWQNGTCHFWDLRWQVREGGELVCQVEREAQEKVTLVVAQCGGFAAAVGSYTWLWAEFGPDGRFRRDLYWVDGAWKEALIGLLMPFQYQDNFYLAAPAETPPHLLAVPQTGAPSTRV